MNRELVAIEEDAYKASYSDGIVDLFVGLSLLIIGAIWVWAADYGGLAGIIPAVMAPSLLPMRKRIVESRGGYVRWSAPRRRWEKRNLGLALAAGVATFALGVAAYLLFESGGTNRDILSEIAPGLLAFILAIGALGLGFMMQHWRFFAYATVLVICGLIASSADANPGWPLIGAGVAVTVVGAAMLTKYLRNNPVVDAE